MKRSSHRKTQHSRIPFGWAARKYALHLKFPKVLKNLNCTTFFIFSNVCIATKKVYKNIWKDTCLTKYVCTIYLSDGLLVAIFGQGI